MMEKMGVKRKRPRRTWRVGERGEGEGQFKAVTHGFLIGRLTDILQPIELKSNCALHWFFLFICFYFSAIRLA